jgi:hypothetical protein
VRTKPLLLLLLILAIPSCKRRNPLAGTWTTEKTSRGGTTTWTNVIANDGRYRCEVVARSGSNTVKTTLIEGTFRIENGMLIEIMTNTTATNVSQLPLISRSKILRMNDREMVLSSESDWGYPTNETVVTKIK